MNCAIPSLFALNTASLAEAAQGYARLGIAVFPLVPRQKVPAVIGGFYRATTDVQVLARWWSQWPQANIGIATGMPTGWCVLDVDPRHHGLTSLQALEQAMRARDATISLWSTLWQLTGGGGFHLVFHMPVVGTAFPGRTIPGYPGIDLKEQGGYIVAPPSQHPNGCCYRWQHVRAPAPLSPTLLDLLIGTRLRRSLVAPPPLEPVPFPSPARSSARPHKQDPEYWLRAALRHAVPGTRHNYALFLAIQLAQVVQCSRAEAAYWMREYVARVPSRPGDAYDLDDALDCLEYAWTWYTH